MKHILILCCILSLGACYREYDTNWAPTPIQEDVGCCITEQQVHGAIYAALLKLRWDIVKKTDNGFIAEIQCDSDPQYIANSTQINIEFKNTDKLYTITADDKKTDVYKYGYCIESHMNKINKYIKAYTKKAIVREAKKEIRGASIKVL